MNGIIEKYGAGQILVGITVLLSVVILGALVLTKGDGPSASEEEFIAIANQVGLDENQFLADFRSDAIKQRVDSQKEEALKVLGSASTPSVFINGEKTSPTVDFDSFAKIVQKKIDEVNADDQTELPVVIEIYEDFNCPHCADFYPITYQTAAEFGDSVDVQHKNLPFLKPSSQTYAIAAESAREQGKFYEYSRAIFEKLHGKNYTELDSLDLNLDTVE